jgi:hypothetical protein
MRWGALPLLAAALLTAPAWAQPQLTAVSVVHSLDATEARQGVASDGTNAYAIDNSRIGKYELKGKTRIAAWEGEPALFPHMNACTLADRKLICAASNYPKVPMTSAIEIFDPIAMKHLSTISLGMGDAAANLDATTVTPPSSNLTRNGGRSRAFPCPTRCWSAWRR